MTGQNRTVRRRGIMLTLLALATTSPGCAPGQIETVPAETVTVAGPYVSVGASAHREIEAVLSATATRHFVLAFALAGQSRCTPMWHGSMALTDPVVLDAVAAVHTAGGSVAVASGGAEGTYLENTCATTAELTDAYRSLVTAVGAVALDIDVETAIPVDRVADALSAIHHELDIGIVITAEVLDQTRGLEPVALSLVRALAERGTPAIANAMTMNFPGGRTWGASLTAAAETVTGQIERTTPGEGRDGAYRRLGLTYMAGRNDTGQVTTLADARALRDYAVVHRIGFLGFWSLARDHGGCPGDPAASEACSGIEQRSYDFTRTLISLPVLGRSIQVS